MPTSPGYLLYSLQAESIRCGDNHQIAAIRPTAHKSQHFIGRRTLTIIPGVVSGVLVGV